MATRTPLRLVIADDHQLFRQGLKALLKQEAGVTVVAETERAGDLPKVLSRTACDQLLLDLQMERNSLPDIESLAKRVAVVVLTASEVPADALAAIRLGARAVVFKRFAVETLMDAIRAVAKGHVWMPATLQTHVATRLQNPAPNDLSRREEQVVRYVALGLRNAEVAKKLSISEQTVKTHLNVIFRKLGIRDRVELALYAARAGIINLDHTH
jgi:DNA-binding NarL/FixJ family response regulator